MDKYQVRACLDVGVGLVYTNTEGTPQGVFAIDTTGANDGDVLTYFSASGTVGWTPGGGGGGGNYWNLLGNAGTNPATNFLGTTDAQDLVIKTDSIERIRVLATGNVGIGVTPTGYGFEVAKSFYLHNDDISGSASIYSSTGSSLVIDVTVSGQFSSSVNFGNGGTSLNWSNLLLSFSHNVFLLDSGIVLSINNDDTKSLHLTDAGSVGIGTASPTDKLHVNGTVRIEDGTQAAGYVLTSDANGVASWQPASGGGGGTTWGSITGTLSSQTDLQSALDALVPYTGATNDVDLDTFSLNAKSLHVKGTGGAGHLGLKHQSADATANANETSIFADVNGDIKYKNDSLYYTTLKTSLNTANRVYTFPDADGTLALTSQLPTPSALTKTDDTNVTLTLGGTPATSLLQSVSLTLGWTGQLSVARGGTGLGTLGTANQLLRVNAGATALEYFTPTYISGLTVGTTTIASGTAGRVLFEGVGNVLQENSNLNFDTTNGLIIGGATARGTRLTVVNSANTQATKIFVQRNAADSADYTTLRGDGSVDFANIGSTANVLVYANGSALIQTYGSAGLRNSLFGLANATSITGGTVAYNTFVGAESTLSSSTGTTAYNTAVGFTTNITNANNCTIVGTFTRMNGATRAIVIGGRSTAGPVRDVTGTDVILLGYGTDANALNYTNSAVFYFNNANASTWFHSNGNLGLFGKKYQILNDSTGTAANRLNTYMDINATNTLTIHNGTPTSSQIADAVQVYAADVVAGNTALFIRTENNAILKLYQETTGVGSATRVGGGGTTLTDTDTFDGYTIAQVVKALRNQGILA